jgi:hypothetical protein
MEETRPGNSEFQRALRAFSERRILQALELLNRAESAGWNADHCGGYRWFCWMLLGRFEEAWRESDRIAASDGPDPNHLWDGLPFGGKRVIIRCLHGFGDAIQFIRYAWLIRRDAKCVIVEMNPKMVSLFEGTPYIDEVISWAGPACRHTEWDQQIEIMELPRAFRTTLSSVPADVPYLCVSPERRARSRIVLGSPEKPHIGIIWAASDWNPDRSVPLMELRQIFDLKQFAFYSLQWGYRSKDISDCGLSTRIHDTVAHSPDIVDTAADLMNMDLLITVDGMAGHLAGSLGRAVWVLLPYEADWRWMLDREDTPWYPTMRLFRQPKPGDWQTPIGQILKELCVYTNGRASIGTDPAGIRRALLRNPPKPCTV